MHPSHAPASEQLHYLRLLSRQFPTVEAAETDEGLMLQAQVDELMMLLNAYRTGAITEGE